MRKVSLVSKLTLVVQYINRANPSRLYLKIFKKIKKVNTTDRDSKAFFALRKQSEKEIKASINDLDNYDIEYLT